MDVFYPEEAFRFIPFSKQKEVIEAMGEFSRLYGSEFPRPEVFCAALSETHEWLAPFFADWPAEQLYRTFRQEFVKNAGGDTKGLIEKYLWMFDTELSRHLTERVALDPVRLLQEATKDPETDDRRSIRYRRYFDCRRRMAIALQYFAIELIDSDGWSSDDLLRVEDLSWERLFDPVDDRPLWIGAVPDVITGRVKDTVVLFLESRKMNKWKSVRKRCYSAKFNCRLVHDGEKTYYIWVDGRWKESRPTLLKLERGRGLTDRRGWKYVVVAVEERGVIRAAKHQDAIAFNDLCRERLWKDPLAGNPKLVRNPNSHTAYRDEKIVGRIDSIRTVLGYQRRVSAQAEQLTLSVDNHVDTITSLDGVNHIIYRGTEIVRTLCPLWLPFSVYGIDWPTFPLGKEPPDKSRRKLKTQRTLVEKWKRKITS